jgi:hypothetical protein
MSLFLLPFPSVRYSGDRSQDTGIPGLRDFLIQTPALQAMICCRLPMTTAPAQRRRATGDMNAGLTHARTYHRQKMPSALAAA